MFLHHLYVHRNRGRIQILLKKIFKNLLTNQTNRVYCNHGQMKGRLGLPECIYGGCIMTEPLIITLQGNLIPNQLAPNGVLWIFGDCFSGVGEMAIHLAKKTPQKTVEVAYQTRDVELECYKVHIHRIGHIRYSVWRVWDNQQNRFRFRAGDEAGSGLGDGSHVFDTQAEARRAVEDRLAQHLNENGAETFQLTYYPDLQD